MKTILEFLYWIFVGLIVMTVWNYKDKIISGFKFIFKEGRWFWIICVLLSALVIYSQLHIFLSYKYAPVHPGVIVSECLKETCSKSKQKAIDRCVLEATRFYELGNQDRTIPHYSDFFITDLRRCLKVENLSLANCDQDKTGCIEVPGKMRSK